MITKKIFFVVLLLVASLGFAKETKKTPETEPASEPATESASTQSASTQATSQPPPPVHISMGVYFLRIDNLDLKAGSATVSYYIWTRWKGDVNPDVDGAAYEIINGTLESKDSEYKYEEGGYQYVYYRCQATVNVKVDFRNFPFDGHTLSIEFEHSEYGTEGVIFEIDADSMKHLHSPAFSGWTVSEPVYSIKDTIYQTNWGMPNINPDDINKSSRFIASITLRHEVSATFTKTFLLLFISMLISYLAFFIHPEELEARIGIGVAGIFGAVTSQSVVTDSLPEISYITLSDKVHIASLLFIFFALLGSCFVGYLARKEQEERAKRIDKIIGICATLSYVILVTLFVVLR